MPLCQHKLGKECLGCWLPPTAALAVLRPRAPSLCCPSCPSLAPAPSLQLCERPAGQGYRGSELFHVRKGFGITGGDWVSSDGTGGRSSFPDGRPFADENFIIRHSQPGVLTMANTGVHSNTSVFFVTLAKAKHLGECSRRGTPCHLAWPPLRLPCARPHYLRASPLLPPLTLQTAATWPLVVC